MATALRPPDQDAESNSSAPAPSTASTASILAPPPAPAVVRLDPSSHALFRPDRAAQTASTTFVPGPAATPTVPVRPSRKGRAAVRAAQRQTKGSRVSPRRSTPRQQVPRPSRLAGGLPRAGAALLGAGLLAGAAMATNSMAPGRLPAPAALAPLAGSAAATTLPATTVKARLSTAPTAPPTSAFADTTVAATTPAPASTTPAGASTVVSTLPSSAPPIPPASTPSPSAAATSAAPAPTTTAMPLVAEATPQPTLPGGQPWPVASRADDGSMVVSGVVPSQAGAERVLASLAWYQGGHVVNQLTIDPSAVAVRYVPVRLLGQPIVLDLGSRDLTAEEWRVLPLWAKFLLEHPSAKVMVAAVLPGGASAEQSAAALDHLSLVQGELLATGAHADQVVARAVTTGDPASTAVSVDIAVAMDGPN